MNKNPNYVVSINKKDFFVEQDEFMKIKHETFSNLIILKDVGKYERITGLLSEMTKVKSINTSPNINTHTLLCVNVTHGGFLAINSSNNFKEIYGICNGENHYKNTTKNIEKINIPNIFFTDKTENYEEIIDDITDNITDNNLIIYIERTATVGEGNIFDDNDNKWLKTLINKYKPCIVMDTHDDTTHDKNIRLEDYKEYKLSNSGIFFSQSLLTRRI